MIPHLLSGTMHILTVRLTCPPERELHEFSTFDAFRDAYEWIEGDGFRYALVPVAHHAKHFELTAYVNLDEELSLGDHLAAIRAKIESDLRSRGRGIQIERIGKPHFFLRLNSVDKKIADAEEMRSEKIFIDLIDS
jgi:MFS superfamily sulfate permease-like transporter